MGVALFHGVQVHQVQEAEEHDGAAVLRLDGQQADLQRPRAVAGQDAGVAQPLGDGERRLVVDAEHADDAVALEDDQVSVFLVELIDEKAGPVVDVLGDLTHEGPVVEPVNLLEFALVISPLEDVASHLQHSWTTSDGVSPWR